MKRECIVALLIVLAVLVFGLICWSRSAHPIDETSREYQQGVGGYAGCEDTYMIPYNEYADSALGGKIFIECIRNPIGDSRMLIRFNDLGLAGNTVTQADLWLYCYLTNGDSQTMTMHRVLRDWVEMAVTSYEYAPGQEWNTLGCGADNVDAEAQALFTLVDGTSEVGWRHFVIPPATAQEWVDAPGDVNDGVLIITTTAPPVSRSFRSAQMFSVSYRPKLIIHYLVEEEPPTPFQD